MSPLPPPVPGTTIEPGQAPRNWFQRNLKWSLPVLVIGIIGMLAVSFWIGSRQIGLQIEGSPAYTEAMRRVSSSDEVAQVLGRPVQVLPFKFGSAGRIGSTGSATMMIRIAGPKGKARVMVDALLVNDHWLYDKLSVELPGEHGRVDLRNDADRDCAILLQCR